MRGWPVRRSGPRSLLPGPRLQLREVEPHRPPARRLRGLVLEQLRRTSAPLAAILGDRRDEAGTVERAPEARLVQRALQQELVDLLQLREREPLGQQLEGDR